MRRNVVLLLVCFREKWCNVVLLLVCFRENLCNAVRCTLVTVTLHLAYALSNHRHFTATVHICFVNQTMHLQIM